MPSTRRAYIVPLPGQRTLPLGERCLVMGILNITPDSFAERFPKTDPDVAIDAALRMQDEGADLIDIGGESTRPGAEPVSADEERRRVLPVIERLAPQLRIPISVDTYKSEVARDAVAAGASIINDVRGLRTDPRVATVAAETGAALIVMHSRGVSKTMYAEAVYEDVIVDATRELGESLVTAAARGVPRERTIVDPGIGFAKRVAHSYGVLARLPELAAALDRPLLVGPSRKSFMRDAIGDVRPAERDWGTAAAIAAAVLAGVHIVRVHNVAAMRQVVRVAEEVLNHG